MRRQPGTTTDPEPAGPGQASQGHFDEFAGCRAVILTTFRRTGEPVATPVWIVADGNRAFVVSRGRGKERRIRANPLVAVARGAGLRGDKAVGPYITACAHVVGDWQNFPYGAPHSGIGRAFRRKYGLAARLAPIATTLARWRFVLVQLSPPTT
jgi:uncharacterized protein